MDDDGDLLHRSVELSDRPYPAVIPTEDAISEDTEYVLPNGIINFIGLFVWWIIPFQPLDELDDPSYLGAACVVSMLLDPLFLYVTLINEDLKCVTVHNKLKITALVLRSVSDLRYLVTIILRIIVGWRKSLSLGKIAMSIAFLTFSLLPIQQVVVLSFLPNMRGSSSLKIMKFLNSLILLQYVTRAYPLYNLYTAPDEDEIIKKTTNRMLDKRFNIIMFLYGYLLSSHVRYLEHFGIFFSIQREIDCWYHAGQTEFGSKFSTSCDDNIFSNVTLINNSCPINPPDESKFNFGIFLYALQSGMQASKNFPQKFLQCFAWGLRNLSSFASNLVSSSYEWENLFVVLISISGLVLFMYLLGYMQTFMQRVDESASLRLKMKKIIEPKIKPLLLEYGIPNKMESKVKHVVKARLKHDEDLMVENMFSIISSNLVDVEKAQDLAMEIKCSLFMDKLNQVNGLKDKGEGVLKTICKYMEPKIYDEECYIVREGEPLAMMFFITLGDVLIFTTNKDKLNGSSSTIQFEKERDGLYGEELLTWAKRLPSKLSNLPISTVTVKSYNKVEVFALKANDLKRVVSEFPSHFNMDTALTIAVHNEM